MAKTSKKKTMSTLLVAVLLVAVAIGGMLAYLQSEDGDVNVMTLGEVKIQQNENFPDGEPPLYPAIGEFKTNEAGLWTNENVVTKEVSIENTGKSPAYVRTWFAFEGGKIAFDKVEKNTNTADWTWTEAGEADIKGVTYYIVYATYNEALPAGAGSETSPSLYQVALPYTATNDDVNAIDINKDGKYKIEVLSQAVQTQGFATAEDALKEAFGTEHPFGPEVVKVTTPEALATALETAKAADGETVIDATGVELTIENNEMFYIAGGVTLKGANVVTASRGGEYIIAKKGAGETVVFEDCTFDRNETGMIVIGSEADGADLVFNNCTFNGPVAPNFVEMAEGASQFNNCMFKIGTASIKQGFVNCMGGTHTFTKCTFDYTGGSTMGSNQYVRWNAVNSYSESGYSTSVILDGCTFVNCGTQRFGSNSTLTVK